MATKRRITIAHVFKTIVWPRKKLLLLGLLLIIISRVSGLALPVSSKYLMDEVIAKHDLGYLENMLLIVTGSIIIQSVTSFMLTQLLSIRPSTSFRITRKRAETPPEAPRTVLRQQQVRRARIACDERR